MYKAHVASNGSVTLVGNGTTQYFSTKQSFLNFAINARISYTLVPYNAQATNTAWHTGNTWGK